MGGTRKKTLPALLACLAFALAVATVPWASAATGGRRGGLDPSFGRGGRVLAKPPLEIEPTVFAAAARAPGGGVLVDLHRQTSGGRTVAELQSVRTPTAKRCSPP